MRLSRCALTRMQASASDANMSLTVCALFPRRLTAELQQQVIAQPPKYYRVSDGLTPTMWFQPTKVWEIRGADLTISPAHSAGAGLVHPSKGISLRFPRFIRERPDKAVDQCTTSEEVARMYQQQHGVRRGPPK